MIYVDYISDFLDDQDIGENSKNVYRRVLNLFFNDMVTHGLGFQEIKRPDVIRWKNDLIDQKKSALTINLYLAIIRTFYNWTEINDIHQNIAGGIKNPRKYIGFKKKPLTRDQVEELMKSINTDTMNGKRDMAIISLMLLAGLRTVEVSRIDYGDMQYQEGMLGIVIQGKGKKIKDTFIKLMESTFEYIQAYLVQRGDIRDEDPMFISHGPRNNKGRLSAWGIGDIIKKRLKDIGLDDRHYTAHSFRHTCAIMALEVGVSLEEVSRKLRHTSIATTQIYTRYMEEKLRLQNDPGDKIEQLIYGGRYDQKKLTYNQFAK